MRRKILATLLLTLVGLLGSSVMAEEDWLDNLDDAIKQARTEKKLVLVEFSTTWCKYCPMFKEEVLQKDEFKKYVSDKFVLVDLDGDKNRELVDKFGVIGYPTILILNSEGKKVHMIQGFKNLDQTLEELKTVQPAQ